ncbi:MAG: ThiF family adenylyltransferase [Rhodothermaceae bacterium]|nr:ThiF family adenylyltransferase [Bacteroidota bacterium]MXW32834.1 ThiF family adenylyltransferase [Rhodothermaceae bacterium]MYE63515.1 ThiF family adenylyltransferase [Rhodothermaceae bacterium]MYJ19735.1 ThiF family adenylyltransferase [Rhodothermaceae bacterium]
MRFEATLSEALAKKAENHLLAQIRQGKYQEDLCFALWRSSTGASRTTGIVTELVLPQQGERNLHGNASFESHYLARVVRKACQTGAGVAFMHSHPSSGWQAMSDVDIVAERDRIAPPARAAGFPLLGLTVGSDGVWSARFWSWNGQNFARTFCDKVRVVGNKIQLSIHPNQTPAIRSNRLRRTLDTWGQECQAVLASLRIGIVGLGSVGAIIAETLGRIGITDILLVDADRIEEHNLDRLLHTTSGDIGHFKVDTIVNHLRRSATAASFHVDAKRAWIQERDAYKAALDCDILFAAVDRPLPKDLLNNLAYVHCIPVVFGGIRVATKPSGRLVDANWSFVRAGPGLQCLRCDGQYTTAEVVIERDGSLDNPTYISPNTATPGNENVFPFATNLGSLMVLEMLRAILHESWWHAVPTKLHYSYLACRLTSQINTCEPSCSVAARMGQGDGWTYPFLDDPVVRRDKLRFRGWLSRILKLFRK